MSKTSKITIALLLALSILAAAFIRSEESAYHLYYKKNYVQAEKYLKELVNSGDGFAAYLMGQNRINGRLGSVDQIASLDKYKKGAELGSIEAAANYLFYLAQGNGWRDAHATQGAREFTHKQCIVLEKLMAYGSLTGNFLATVNAARFHLWPACAMQPNNVKAAYFFELSRRIDPRMGVRFYSLFLKMTLAEQERVLALLKKPIKLITHEDYFRQFWATLKELERD